MSLHGELKRFIVSELLFDHDAVAIDDDTDLLGLGLVDSLGLARLVAHLEEVGLTVADDDLVPENFATLARLLAFVERKRDVRP
jgi:acyl carrier protein